jgi:hypothetical protein
MCVCAKLPPFANSVHRRYTGRVPVELVKRLDLDLLYPPFLVRLLAMLADCKAAGREYCATLGYRTWPAQDALYARGRTAPGLVVTNARGGQSAHNYGIAVDFFSVQAREPGEPMVPNWAPESYDMLGAMAVKHGLLWGGTWTALPDRPHVQVPRYVTAEDLAPLEKAFTSPLLPELGDTTQNALHRAWAMLDQAKLFP